MSKRVAAVLGTLFFMTMISTPFSTSALSVHQPVTKVFLVNREPAGVILLAAKVNVQDRIVRLLFNPTGVPLVAKIEIGEITGSFGSINRLQLEDLECKRALAGQEYQSKDLSLPELKEGMTLVIWVTSVKDPDGKQLPLADCDILQAARAIQLEQERLGFIGAIEGQEVMIDEAVRNFEE